MERGFSKIETVFFKYLTERNFRNLDLVNRFEKLKKFVVIEVGTLKIAILHGDVDSLSGWKFSVEVLEPLDHKLRESFGVPHDMITHTQYVLDSFKKSQVDAFAVTHTCLPFGQDFADPTSGKQYVILNNGSAGMPNFISSNYGLLSRIGLTPCPATIPRPYGIQVKGVYFDAVAIHYDQQAFVTQFLANWPPTSPAHLSYFSRISAGPKFHLHQAIRGNFHK